LELTRELAEQLEDSAHFPNPPQRDVELFRLFRLFREPLSIPQEILYLIEKSAGIRYLCGPFGLH
jgi:hypothetical protein